MLTILIDEFKLSGCDPVKLDFFTDNTEFKTKRSLEVARSLTKLLELAS